MGQTCTPLERRFESIRESATELADRLFVGTLAAELLTKRGLVSEELRNIF